MSRLLIAALLAAALVAVAPAVAPAASPAGTPLLPPSLTAARPLPAPPVWTSPAVDRAAALVEDEGREAAGLPPRFALTETVAVTPDDAGTWQTLADGSLLWRLRVTSAGALSLNFGFPRFHLPEGAALYVHAAGWDGTAAVGRAYRFTAAEGARHGQLWTPVVLGPEADLELAVPAGRRPQVDLLLGAINAGYRGFGEPGGGQVLQKLVGDCYLDVACPEADPWRTAVRSVAAMSYLGSHLCTGFMVNNTAQDARPLFMTANHCGVSTASAPSLVVYWNFESPGCDTGQPALDYQTQTGATWRAAWEASDFTLLELDDEPDPAWGVTFAGWSRAAAPPTSSACIHHPDGTEKRISFDFDPARVTSYSFTISPGDGTHLQVVDWDVGSTEGGSSGSPLFDQNHRVVGQLHGGFALCGNDQSDWFGRLAASWTGGGTTDTGLRAWLDPAGTGALVLDALDLQAAVRVLPEGAFVSSGRLGGPFSPADFTLTILNQTVDEVTVPITSDVAWLRVDDPAPVVAAGGRAQVAVTITGVARQLPEGVHEARITLTVPGQPQIVRLARLTVGTPHVLISFPFDDDPHWQTEGLWAFGRPTGQAGDHGSPDPTSGHTGSYVYGYNLGGGYTNGMPAYSLTSAPLDCSAYDRVTLRFWRWLGVEEAGYDQASVAVSNDGSTWRTVWVNPQDAPVDDGRWVEQDLDISDTADQQAAVQVRWTMGPTDPSWTWCGWNLDDVQIWGLDREHYPTAADTSRTALVRVGPNPFHPGGSPLAIDVELRPDARARLHAYDLRGRLVATLLDEPGTPGPRRLTWDGRDDRRRRLPGGVYVLRLEQAGMTERRKVTLLP